MTASPAIAPSPPPPSPPRTRRTRRRLFGLLLGLWRAALLLLTVAVASQPVTMGRYLAGDYPMIGLHGTLGSAVAALALLVVALSVGYALAGGRPWVVPACVLLFLACGIQARAIRETWRCTCRWESPSWSVRCC